MILLPRIFKIFEGCAGFSNLGLSPSKTIVIPLTHGGHRIGIVKEEVLNSIKDEHSRKQIEK